MANGIIAKKLPEWVAMNENGVRCGSFGESYLTQEMLERLRDKDWKRGRISGFTRHSARRLREALFGYYIPDSKCYGLTLTVPWVWADGLLPEWRRVTKCFAQSFRRQFPQSAIIYRVELQRRGAPHLHVVAYLAESATPAALQRLWFDSVTFRRVGRKTVPNPLHGGDLVGFNRYGSRVDALDAGNSEGLFRYLCDHASKHKASQLGYEGRQWGFVNRPALVRRECSSIVFSSDAARRWFFRYLRKVQSYTVKDARCVFGCRKVVGRRTFGVSFLRHGGSSALRLLDCSERTALACQ